MALETYWPCTQIPVGHVHCKASHAFHLWLAWVICGSEIAGLENNIHWRPLGIEVVADEEGHF